MLQAPVVDVSTTSTCDRRLVALFLNNPSTRVTKIHREPGPPDRVQVIITLETSDII